MQYPKETKMIANSFRDNVKQDDLLLLTRILWMIKMKICGKEGIINQYYYLIINNPSIDLK